MPAADTNQQAAHLADVAAKLPSQLWANHLFSFDDFATHVLSLPASTCEMLIKQGEFPPMFLLGRRRYILAADARKWLDKQAKARPYVPRRNAKRSGSDLPD